ncbi:MAG TPA: hypothetical protein VFW07_03435 [Parafilimonas sp.]|nr:hypothetical protein [Parafilimonas sp.]
MAQRSNIQHYPRIQEEGHKFIGFFDNTKFKDHTVKISIDTFKKIIQEAITNANLKSSRAILNIENINDQGKINDILKKGGKELFKYFIKYCGDPAATAYDCLNIHYSKVAREQFRNRTIQKERMNSGWRYQFIARDAAIESGRFKSISDIGAAEADFNAILLERDANSQVNIYVSVKNRANTVGGQDLPKAIRALEEVAKGDKNRTGPYLCVFGIAMDKGQRVIRLESKTKQPYSNNTEIWLSDFFWPFFANYNYDEVSHFVLQVLLEQGKQSSLNIKPPQELIESFGDVCKEYNLVDEDGIFNDAYKLVDLFCGKLKK